MIGDDIIIVRDYSGTHIAKLRKSIASCTAGRRQAADAVARKVMGSQPYRLEELEIDRVWKVVQHA
jgi:hypothetical protein